MYATRLLGIPHGPFKGGRRAYALQQKRIIYTPNWGIRRIKTSEGDRDFFIPRIKQDFIGPPPAITPRPPFWDYVRKDPSNDPPPKAKVTFIKQTIIVPPGTVHGFNGGVFKPGEVVLPDLYTVPFDWVYEIKKLLITPLDTSYDTLYVGILQNGGATCHVQGANRLPADDHANFSGAGWELLPNWPQDQFNTVLRFRSNDKVGIRVVNNTFAEREVHVAIFGWKYYDTYELGMLGLK